jgi:Flp pilus assembly protein TadG
MYGQTPAVAHSVPDGSCNDKPQRCRGEGEADDEGVHVKPRTRMLAEWLRRRTNDEAGAELVEFAIVIVLLITILYGILTFGLILAAQATLTQAAADAARAGLVASPNAVTAAETEAGTDIGWMDKGPCGTSTTSTAITTCIAAQENCPSNATIQCLKVTVTYNYSESPLFPELPGLGLVTPSTISSTNIIQLGTVS